MMNDEEALKRLHQAGWKGTTLDSTDKVGETALMHALRAYWKRIPGGPSVHVYDLHALVEYLIPHPLIDVHAKDKEGHNALWYCFDFHHAYPLLAKAGVDFNTPNYEGFHLLEQEMMLVLPYNSEEKDAMSEKLILAAQCGLNLRAEYGTKPFWTTFPEPFRSVAEQWLVQEDVKRLQTLPKATKNHFSSPKL